MRGFPLLFLFPVGTCTIVVLYWGHPVYSNVIRSLVDREVKVIDLWRPFRPILTSTISRQLPKCVVPPFSLFLYVRHICYENKSGIHDIAEIMLKLTMNADKRNEVFSALVYLPMICFFDKKMNRNTSKTGKKYLTNRELYLSLKQNSGINTESESAKIM